MRQPKQQLAASLISVLVLTSFTSLLISNLLCNCIVQQRIVQNFIKSDAIYREIDQDLLRLIHAETPAQSETQYISRTYIPDNSTPNCPTGTWFYEIMLTHRRYSTYKAHVILSQKVNVAINFWAKPQLRRYSYGAYLAT